MTKQWILGVLVLAASWQAQAADLWEVYQLALQNDPTYQAASAEYDAAKEAKPQAWAEVKPQLNLSGNHTEVIDENRTTSSLNVQGDDYSSDTYSLTLNQTLYNQAQFDAIDRADASVAQAEADLRNAKNELIIRVANRYFDVLGAKDELEFARAEKEAIEQQLFQTKQRFEVGLTAITDVHEAQARFDQSVAQEIQAQNQLAVSRELLREMIGQSPKRLATLTEQVELVRPEPENVEYWVEKAMDNNLSLLAAQKAKEVAQYNLEVARAGHYPTLDLQADYTDTESGGGFFGQTKRDGTSVALVLNIPLYSGGGTSAVSRENAARYQQSKDLYEQQRRATERQARNTYLTTLSNISQVKAFKQALVSSQTALDATQAGFEVGTRTAVDVLNFQQEVFRAKSNYAQSRYDYIVQLLRLQDAAGTLSDADIKKINRWLQ